MTAKSDVRRLGPEERLNFSCGFHLNLYFLLIETLFKQPGPYNGNRRQIGKAYQKLLIRKIEARFIFGV